MLKINILKKIFGSDNEREISRIKKIVDEINQLEERYSKEDTSELKKIFLKLKNNESNNQNLDLLIPDVFAIVREISKRKLGLRPYDVQLIGGVVLHEGKIAEMKTGEGKTLVACMPVILNSIKEEGVHLVTVNDYLARRDALWMSPIYMALGLTVGISNNDKSYIVESKDDNEFSLMESKRQEIYQCDIVYGTNSEFGFDYLRDNMKYSFEEVTQRGHSFAIVDEVDSILIDEARTPLIISGPNDRSSIDYKKINKAAKNLTGDDISKDEKTKQVFILDSGVEKIEDLLNLNNLYDPTNLVILHSVNQSLRALHMFERDNDYVVQDDKIIIVDEFTGRLMPSRRWSDGLHQAIEIKENVDVEEENQTLASITIQNYFRMYDRLSGMTGTADTEAVEFQNIYNLKVIVIPTNAPMIRNDVNDLIYRTEKEKFAAILNTISEFNKKGNPILVGTISVEKSERLSNELKKRNIDHKVLNAKNHEYEADIVAQAGRLGSVTIATNMAGRGTDIMLGGNKDFILKDNTDKSEREKIVEQISSEKEKIVNLDGLVVLGSERHESRRIDNQLRGRSGRQGDPGISQFFVSMEDDLMRLFGSERIASMMTKLGWKEGEPMEHKMITGSLENAQKKVEGRNYEVRKHLIEYDDVQSQQREVVYGIRNKLLKEERSSEILDNILENMIQGLNDNLQETKKLSDTDKEFIRNQIGFDIEDDFESLSVLEEKIYNKIKEKISSLGDLYQPISKFILITTLDIAWKDHLLNMDYLRESVGLRAYGQKNPLNEYKKEGFETFETMLEKFNFEALERFLEVEPITSEEIDKLEKEKNQTDKVEYSDSSFVADSDDRESEKEDTNTKRSLDRSIAEKGKAKRRKLGKQKKLQRKKQRK